MGQTQSNVDTTIINYGSDNDNATQSLATATTDWDVSPNIDVSAPIPGLDNPTFTNNLYGGERLTAPYNSNVDTHQIAEMMSLCHDNLSLVKREHFGVDEDELNVMALAARFTRVHNVAWTTADSVGTRLFQHWMSPFQRLTSEQNPKYFINSGAISPMETYAMINAFWRGDLEVRLEIVASEFHAGRLYFGLHYGEYDYTDLLSWTLGQVTGQYGQYINVREGVTEYNLTLKYLASTPWLNSFSTLQDIITWAMGMYSITVVNELVAPATISQNLEINVYFAAGTNFAVHYPRPFSNLVPILNDPWDPAPLSEPIEQELSGLNMVVTEQVADSSIGIISYTDTVVSDLAISTANVFSDTTLVDSFELQVFERGLKYFAGIVAYLGEPTAWDVQSITIDGALTSFNSSVNSIGGSGLDGSLMGFAGQFDETADNVTVHVPFNRTTPGGTNWPQVVTFFQSETNTLSQIYSTTWIVQVDGSTPSAKNSTQFMTSFTTTFDSSPVFVTIPGGGPEVSFTAATPEMDFLVGFGGLPVGVPIVAYFRTSQEVISVDVEEESSAISFVVNNKLTADGQFITVVTAKTVAPSPTTLYNYNLIFASTVFGTEVRAHWLIAMNGTTSTQVHLQAQVEAAAQQQEEQPVAEHEVVSQLIGFGGKSPRYADHFGEQFRDLRDGMRRFVEVDSVTLDSGQALEIPIIDLFKQHPFFRLGCSMFRLMRGNLRVRIFGTRINATDLLKIRVSPTPYTLAEPPVTDFQTGLATKVLMGVTPSMTFEVPYLSTLHSVYTPYAVPSGGSALSPTISFDSTFTQNETLRIFVAVGDNFRMGAFTGAGSFQITDGPPSFYRPSTTNVLLTQRKYKKRIVRDVHLQSGDSTFDFGGISVAEARTAVATKRSIRTNDAEAALHMPEQNWSVPDLLRRPCYSGTLSWNTGQPIGTVLATFQVPFGLLQNNISKIPTTNFRFLRFHKITMRLQVNGTPMHSGRLIAFYQPGVVASDFSARFSVPGFATTLNSHVMLNPAKATVGEIEVPFNHPLGYLHVNGDSIDENFTRFNGYIHVVVFNPLTIGDSGSTAININLLTYFDNLEAKVPLATTLAIS